MTSRVNVNRVRTGHAAHPMVGMRCRALILLRREVSAHEALAAKREQADWNGACPFRCLSNWKAMALARVGRFSWMVAG